MHLSYCIIIFILRADLALTIVYVKKSFHALEDGILGIKHLQVSEFLFPFPPDVSG